MLSSHKKLRFTIVTSIATIAFCLLGWGSMTVQVSAQPTPGPVIQPGDICKTCDAPDLPSGQCTEEDLCSVPT